MVKCEFEKDKEFADVGYRLAPDLKRRFALHNTGFRKSRALPVSLSPERQISACLLCG